ncbi:hypothetical protein LTR11_001693 [Exophiala xenobiotica]|nr:hypothetical protein LTS06_000717 [Exophiala xenobiotica]KAK5385320.1 hypothetical protein LTR11_001693 [Exophiala xenobiotica]
MSTPAAEPHMESSFVERSATASNSQENARVLAEQDAEPAEPASPTRKDNGTARRLRAARKKRNQQQLRKALTTMMESFQSMFDDSHADISDLDDDSDRAILQGSDIPQPDDEKPPYKVSDVSALARSMSLSGAHRRRGAIEDDIELCSPGPISRTGTALEEINPGPIEYGTELYEYKRSPDRDQEEPDRVNTVTTPAPTKVTKTGARFERDDMHQSGPVFKVVHMYAVPTRANDRTYSSGRPLRPVPVTASVGGYLVIYSDVIMSAIRSCVQSYPGLSRAFEHMIIPAPYALIVQYRKELQEYSEKLADQLVSLPRDEPASPMGHGADDDDETGSRAARVPALERNKHIPLLLDYVLTPELKAQIGHEMALRKKPVAKCTYAMAWLLYRPGTIVYAWGGGGLDSALLIEGSYIVDWYELEGLYAKDDKVRRPYAEPVRRRPGGLAEAVRPPPTARGELAEFSPVPKSIIVKLHYLEFDGEHVGRRLRIVTIAPFEGEKEICMLPVCPAEFAPDPKIRETLVARGQKYIGLCQPSYMAYNGGTLATATIPSRKVNGRVMIDTHTFYHDETSERLVRQLRLKLPNEDGIIVSETSSNEDNDDSDYRGGHARKRKAYRKRIRDHKKMPIRGKGMAQYDIVEPGKIQFTEDQLILFPARIWGFVLRERRWYLLNINHLKDPPFQENIIDDLVLKDEAKNLIQALSNTQINPSDGTSAGDDNKGFSHFSADIIPNKGEGRIFLLHGKPGVGKTSTAECAAESARVPLLAITCGDLGTEAWAVERALMRWFKLATLWKAVLLIDEADVYLESRMSGDLARNSGVSIFLRALEYYQGVLFLTTNRVGTFDEAVLSRIHVVLHYDDFSDSERQRIWTTSFRKLAEDRPDVKVGPGFMDYALENQRVLDLKWNGREIRNAFNTTVALAEFDAEKKRRAGKAAHQVVMERSHLVQVVKMSEEFRKYMKRTRGLDESALAKAMKIRDDAALQRIMDVTSK